MRSFSLALGFFCALSAQAESARPDLAREQQSLDHVRQFARTHLERAENLSCSQVAAAGASKTITVDFSDVRKRGPESEIEASNLIQNVFAVSSAAEFHWDHSATIAGKTLGVYSYGYQVNGKTHAGLIFADENTGAISRMTFRGADAPAHLFCSARTR